MSFTTRRALWWGLRRIVAPLAAFLLLATQLVLPTPAEAAKITFRSAATAVSAGEGALEIDTPGGVEPGDLLADQQPEGVKRAVVALGIDLRLGIVVALVPFWRLGVSSDTGPATKVTFAPASTAA